MKLARGTSSWLAIAWGATALLVILALAVHPGFWGLAIPVLVAALILLNFFRDPERTPGAGIVSPADGVIQTIDDPEGPTGRRRVAVFMNPFDVHVNRAPIDAKVVAVKHQPGGFIPAYNKDSERNERFVWDLETAIGDVRMIQIAGTLARRIIPYLEAGATITKGDRIGIIRLGSRVDLYLPRNMDIAVKVGDRVTAGESTLATLPGKGA